MKTRERIKRTRESKSWSEQFSLVHEQLPGTRMDGLFSLLLGILRTSKTKTPAHVMTGLSLVKSDLAGLDIELIASDGDRLQSFGMEIARLIKSGNSDFFREMASAVDAWNSPRPEPDKFRVALFRFCIPQGKSFTMRAIIEHLREVARRIVHPCPLAAA